MPFHAGVDCFENSQSFISLELICAQNFGLESFAVSTSSRTKILKDMRKAEIVKNDYKKKKLILDNILITIKIDKNIEKFGKSKIWKIKVRTAIIK